MATTGVGTGTILNKWKYRHGRLLAVTARSKENVTMPSTFKF